MGEQTPMKFRSAMHEPQGILEEYRGGLLEVLPDEDDLDWWRTTALYMSDGEVFEPSPRLYSTPAVALGVAKKLVDWLLGHPEEIGLWGCFTPDGNTLKRNCERYGQCRLPYYVEIDDGVLNVLCPDSEAAAAGWAEAQDID